MCVCVYIYIDVCVHILGIVNKYTPSSHDIGKFTFQVIHLHITAEVLLGLRGAKLFDVKDAQTAIIPCAKEVQPQIQQMH